MKKGFNFVLVFVMLLSLCACSQESTESAESSLKTTITTNTTISVNEETTTKGESSTTLAPTSTTTKTTTTKASTTLATTSTTTKATTTKASTTKATTITTTPTTTKPTISKEEYAERLNFWFTGISQDYNDDYDVGDPVDEFINFSHLTYFLAENINPEYKIQSVTIDSVNYKGKPCMVYESENKDLLMAHFTELCDWWDDIPPLDDALKIYNPLKAVVLEIKPDIYYKEGWGIDLKEEDSIYTINYTITFTDGDKVSLQKTDNRLATGGGGIPLSPEKLQ